MTNPDRIRAAQAATDAHASIHSWHGPYTGEWHHYREIKPRDQWPPVPVRGEVAKRAMRPIDIEGYPARLPGSTWIGLALVWMFSMWLAWSLGRFQEHCRVVETAGIGAAE